MPLWARVEDGGDSRVDSCLRIGSFLGGRNRARKGTLDLPDKGLESGISQNKCAKVVQSAHITPRKVKKVHKSSRIVTFRHFYARISTFVTFCSRCRSASRNRVQVARQEGGILCYSGPAEDQGGDKSVILSLFALRFRTKVTKVIKRAKRQEGQESPLSALCHLLTLCDRDMT